LGDYNFNFN